VIFGSLFALQTTTVGLVICGVMITISGFGPRTRNLALENIAH